MGVCVGFVLAHLVGRERPEAVLVLIESVPVECMSVAGCPWQGVRGSVPVAAGPWQRVRGRGSHTLGVREGARARALAGVAHGATAAGELA